MAKPFPNQVQVVVPRDHAVTGLGDTWVDPANVYDGDDATQAYVSPMAADAKSKWLNLTDFALGWFDNTLHDMVGITIFLRCHAELSMTSIEFYVIDETGSNLGSINTIPITAVLDPSEVLVVEMDVDIPYATYSSANFGFKVRFQNGPSGGDYASIYFADVIPRFTRKEIHTATYGLQILTSIGGEVLGPSSAFIRQIYTKSRAGGFTGTISATNFDDNTGVFYFYFDFVKYQSDTDTVKASGTSWESFDYLYLIGHGMEIPNVSWDNSTKVATISTGSTYPLTAGFEETVALSCPWTMVFIHYR